MKPKDVSGGDGQAGRSAQAGDLAEAVAHRVVGIRERAAIAVVGLLEVKATPQTEGETGWRLPVCLVFHLWAGGQGLSMQGALLVAAIVKAQY